MLIHICCSVDSHYFLQSIQKEYPQKKLVGYFYNPNIHPYEEYLLRLNDVKRSCSLLGIKLIEGEYLYEDWMMQIKGYEQEPEKGDRCNICFEDRLVKSIQKAQELGIKAFTTTLLMSPKKSQKKLHTIGEKLATYYGVEWIFRDFRSGNGAQLQSQEVKKNRLYRQNYCGCFFALSSQRNQDKKFLDELVCNVGNQVAPGSIESRMQLYEKVAKMQALQNKFFLYKKKILNWRLLYATLEYQKKSIPSYFIAYSSSLRRAKAKVEFQHKNVFYANRYEIKFIEIEYVNTILKKKYHNVAQMIFSPPSFEDEVLLRNSIACEGAYDMSPIVVVDTVFLEFNYTLTVQSRYYEDTVEQIILT